MTHHRSNGGRASAVVALVAFATLTACSSDNVTLTRGQPTSPPVATAKVRAVHASPDAGPVDVYVYTGSTRPGTPAVAGAAYPQITNYLTVPAGTYTVDVLPRGAAASSSAVASESVTVTGGSASTIVVAGKVASSTLQFVNFVEPAETAGQTALVVHHASPFVQSAIAPVGVGIYNEATYGTSPPPASGTIGVFAFSLAPASGPATSGAFPGNVTGGEYFLSPIPSALPNGSPLPTAIGFAAGAFTAALSPLGSVAVSATPSQLAAGLQNPTAAQQTLAGDTSAAIPAGAHLSIFAVDTASAAQLIGTLDP